MTALESLVDIFIAYLIKAAFTTFILAGMAANKYPFTRHFTGKLRFSLVAWNWNFPNVSACCQFYINLDLAYLI